MAAEARPKSVTWGLESFDGGMPTEECGTTISEDIATQMGELHADILSAARVVKQVQREVTHLKLENEVLRNQLKFASGEKQGERQVVLSSQKPSASLTPVLPFCPEEVPGPSKSLIEPESAVSLKSVVKQSSLKQKVKESVQIQKRKVQFNAVGTKHDVTNETTATQAVKRISSVFDRDLALRDMLFDPETMKQKMKKAIVKPDFNINRFYYDTGLAQKVARSPTFEHVTLVAILLNTLWIAVDTEHNDADILLDAPLGFQIAEHCFCSYFFGELLIRFAAFQNKRNCMRSGWFIFDAFLVMAMVFEDWIVTIILLASVREKAGDGMSVGMIKDAAILRILRLLRLARLGRAVKLIRRSPEVMIMVKALAASTRCVLWTCVLLACTMFFFGVAFTQMCKDTDLQKEFFPSLTGSLYTLLIAALFPDLDSISFAIKSTHLFYWGLFMLYLMMTTITILNLLIGVLVEVAQSSARMERDSMDVAYVKEVFVSTLNLSEVENFQAIYVCEEEFADLLQEQDIIKALTKVGIDVFGLIDLLDFIFMRGPIGFVELLEMVLQLRSSADVTVRDLVDLRKFLSFEMTKMKAELSSPPPIEGARKTRASAET